MAVIQDGAAGAGKQRVAPNTLAADVGAKPTDVGTLGAYKWGGFSGVIAAALGANSEIYQFRWSNSPNLCLIQRVRFSACVSTTFFVAGVPVQIELRKAISWSVAGTVGTAITMGSDGKMRETMGNSLMASGDMRISTTVALGAGTKTIGGNALGAIVAPGPITASLNGQIVAPGTPLWEPKMMNGMHPGLLAVNEGFVIRSVAVPGTGTWQFAVDVDWIELASF